MLTWGNARTICQDLAADTETATLTKLDRFMNVAKDIVLAAIGSPVVEDTATDVTVASQQYYPLPTESQRLKSITITVGGIPYPIQEEESQWRWNIYNATQTSTSDIPIFFFIRFRAGREEIGIFPIPASADNTITYVFERRHKDLDTADAALTTTDFTNDDATVASTTEFTSDMVGRWLKNDTDGHWYKIVTFTSTSSIELEKPYEGADATNGASTVAEIFPFPEDLHMLPIYYALWHYFKIKRSPEDATEYMGLWRVGLEEGKRRWGRKTRSGIIKSKSFRTRYLSFDPNNPPRDLT